MANQSFTISEINDYVIFGNDDPYVHIADIIDYDINIDTQLGTEELHIEFRWSNNSHTYSEWYELTLVNLKQYIYFNKYNEFWVDFRVTLLSSGNITINSIVLNVEHINDYNSVPLLIAYPREKGSHHLPNVQPVFSFNPYTQAETIKQFKELNQIVNLMYGHEVTYFRANPKTRSRDVIFLEWSLYEYDEPKNVKLIVPNNEFPDNTPHFNNWGIDFEIPFEVQIDKRYWESVFGVNTQPQKRDAVYFPLTNRMYKIESSSMARDFMQVGSWYKLSLVKWVDQSNIKQSENIKNLIDDVTLSVEKLFGEEIKAEMAAVVNVQQTTDKTTKEDPIRTTISDVDINSYIVENTLENANTTIAHYYYDMQALHTIKPYTTCLYYKAPVDIKPTKNLAFTCWFNMPANKEIKKSIKSITFSSPTIATIEFNYGMPNINVDGWAKISDTTNPNIQLIGKVKSKVSDVTKFKAVVEFPQYLIERMSASYPNWAEKTTLECHDVARRSLLNGWENNKGISVDIFDNNLLRLMLNNIDYWYDITNLSHDYWYGLVINLSNSYNQIGIHIWKRAVQNLKTTKLEKVFSTISSGINNVDRSADINYSLLASNVKITNIRLLSETLEEEKHSVFLNQNIISEAHVAIIVDNAIPKLKLPYIGNVK